MIRAGLLLGLCFLGPSGFAAEPIDPDAFEFDDFPLDEALSHPEWFKHSFLDLREDLAEALEAGKKGIIVYFGQAHCPYCRMLLETNFGQDDIVTYTRQYFDLIPIDIWGAGEVTDFDGNVLAENEFAVREETNFTPSLIFYDSKGAVALRLRGYYPPYKFRAALEYVSDGHYRKESFADYLARADAALKFESDELSSEPFYSPPPHHLDRSRMRGERPLVVFFEQGDCHACDILHGDPLSEPRIREVFEHFDSVQLDIRSDTPVVTPQGKRTTSKQWARDLGLFYTPSLLFFDEQGDEIIRVDSVVRFYRLRNVLTYISTRGYLKEPNYQKWRVSSGL